MSGPLHQPRRTWTPGEYTVRTLQRLCATADALLDADLLAVCHSAQQGPGRRRTISEYRRDTLLTLEDRGYLERGPERNTWRLCAEARAEVARLAVGQAGIRARLAGVGDDAAPEGDATLLASRIAPQRPTLADLVRPDLRDAITRSIVRPPMSAADRAPCTARAGADEAQRCPSRRGERLYWRDGRVTTLDGAPVGAP